MELDFTKPEDLQRRDGGEFRIYATDHEGAAAIVGAIKEGSTWFVQTWARSGKSSGELEHKYDLIPKPARVTGWQNAYPPTRCVIAYKTREEAIRYAAHDCLGQIYIDAEIQP